ncbi:LON peptidase substrate-binding domain-containing protein [Cucumibacter marinus]|uniref:LON peptidase substrate-binding domain-containing protein n=1 Tax=Cucumibacter marinus TaxID=1121252 RepID=UPI00041D6CCF|nr:LON peptidase substrate-binding domain-containing protein [Cucumibacter marinus]
MKRVIRSLADIPDQVPIFPLAGALLLPRMVLPLNIFEPRYLAMVDHALAGDRLIGVIQPAIEPGGATAEGDSPPLSGIGTIGRITHFEERPDNRYLIGLMGIIRFNLASEVESFAPFRKAEVECAPFESDFEEGHGEEDVDRHAFLAALRDYADFAEFEIDWDDVTAMSVEDLVNSCVMASPYGPRERQALLETSTLRERAEMLTALAEVEMSRSAPGRNLQ